MEDTRRMRHRRMRYDTTLSSDSLENRYRQFEFSSLR
jgi:hypothetical protein